MISTWRQRWCGQQEEFGADCGSWEVGHSSVSALSTFLSMYLHIYVTIYLCLAVPLRLRAAGALHAADHPPGLARAEMETGRLMSSQYSVTILWLGAGHGGHGEGVHGGGRG